MKTNLKYNTPSNIWSYTLDWCICGYLICVLFYGFIIHIGLSISLVNSIRVFLPELFLMVSCFKWIFKTPKISKDMVYLLVIFIIVSILSITTIKTMKSVLFIIRDLLIPMLMLAVCSSCPLSEEKLNKIFKHIRFIFILFIVVGVFFGMLQQKLGWEWTSEYFAGYSFYGVNKDASLRIFHGTFGFCVLGTTGSSVNFGFYNALACLFMMYYGIRKKWINLILILLSVYNIIISGNKTALLGISILFLVKIVLPRKGNFKTIFKCIIILIVGIFFIWLITYGNDSLGASMVQRLILWKELFTEKYILNLIIPHNLFFFSSGSDNSGIIDFWDNGYFYYAFSMGISGLILYSLCIYKRWKYIKRYENNTYITYLLIFLLLASFSTCVFFGRCIITYSMIMIGLMYSRSKGEHTKQ